MRKLLYAVLLGLIGAAMLHIVLILGLPRFSTGDAYSRVLGLFEMDSFFSLTREPGATGLSDDDPFLRVAVCGFSVAGGPVRFTASGDVPFWSLALYDSTSNEVFSMNDATAVNRQLDVIAATPRQLTDLRKLPSDALGPAILVEMPDQEGYAVLRALAPTPSYEEGARAFLAKAGCDTVRP
ncbi:DUF1254 domain-containing protein [Xaviernesmea oryzae]|uniref:DUF1254 domain-containing protein n=1 Tax=Xaviernesmea oryzae TaxID=464029 RepID=A0A1Q9ARB3_9HYPH|nr:DUF1254 domain-containing protein [Xaviernesmea oryzae]OLP57983.1 DUF1254 domain-containing protein [Xaviernesmea oryzae]SEL27898.1 Uncharacterized membrane protein [Xaviernesmea oryzae]